LPKHVDLLERKAGHFRYEEVDECCCKEVGTEEDKAVFGTDVRGDVGREVLQET
jgi:hypothetical protein